MTDVLTPVAPEERLDALDMLRGWAMFGVLWSNLNDAYSTLPPATTTDHVLSFMQEWFIESRFYSLLILLFGIGFGIQLTRAAARGTDVRTTYYRRSAALLVIGIIHGTLIWGGDILTMYALVAFALVMFRAVSNRRLLVWAFTLATLGPVIVGEVMFLCGLRVPIGNTTILHLWSTGTWIQIEPMRVAGYLHWFGRWGLTIYPTILASFLAGLWAVKSGYFRRVIEDPRVTRRMLFWALAASVIGYAIWIYGAKVWPPPNFRAIVDAPFASGGFQLAMLRDLVMRLLNWGVQGSALVYASLLLLLFQTPIGKRILRPLAAAGRMALTTYLTQSVVCTLLFYGYGLGWYGRVGFTGMFVVTLVLFSAQMAASVWWLTRFKYGPVEWVWRTMTYGRAPEMLVAST